MTHDANTLWLQNTLCNTMQQMQHVITMTHDATSYGFRTRNATRCSNNMWLQWHMMLKHFDYRTRYAIRCNKNNMKQHIMISEHMMQQSTGRGGAIKAGFTCIHYFVACSTKQVYCNKHSTDAALLSILQRVLKSTLQHAQVRKSMEANAAECQLGLSWHNLRCKTHAWLVAKCKLSLARLDALKPEQNKYRCGAQRLERVDELDELDWIRLDEFS